MLHLVFFAFLLAFSSFAYGVDLFLIYGRSGCPSSGAIVRVDSSAVTLLTLEGSQRRISRADITGIAQYRTVENPFKRFAFDRTSVMPYRVVISGDEKPYVGYATYFLPGLVFLLSPAGSTRVIELSDVVGAERMRPDSALENGLNPFSAVRLVPAAQFSAEERCNDSVGNQSAVPIGSHRIFVDKIHLISFLQDMERGYDELEKLVERVSFYPRPLMLTEKSRFGITFSKPFGQEEIGLGSETLGASLPVYIETGGGTPYGYQGYVRGGSFAWEQIPSFEPTFGFATRFKAHALHGALIGNLEALSAGKSIFYSRFSTKSTLQPWSSSSFNHMTLFGFDYGIWSFSMGNYYQSFALGYGIEAREFRMPNGTWMFRAGLIAREWEVENFLSFNSVSVNLIDKMPAVIFDITDLSIQDDSDNSLNYFSSDFRPRRANLKAFHDRVNGRWLFGEDLVLGGSLLFEWLRYEESGELLRLDQSSPAIYVASGTRESHVESLSYGAELYFRIDLGQWIALRGETWLLNQQFTGRLGSGGGEFNRRRFVLAGALEVLL